MLEVRDLDLFYGDAQALDGVSLDVAEGEIVAIIGANGAGKSSLIRSHPRHASARRAADPLRRPEIAGWPQLCVCDLGIGQVAEGRQVFPKLTVLENLEMGAVVPRARAGAAARDGARFRALPAACRARSASSPARSRAASSRCWRSPAASWASRASSCSTSPHSGLAPLVVDDVFRVIRELNERQRLTILLVEQNVAQSLSLAHRGYVLENGRIVMSGPGAALLADDRVRRAYVGL